MERRRSTKNAGGLRADGEGADRRNEPTSLNSSTPASPRSFWPNDRRHCSGIEQACFTFQASSAQANGLAIGDNNDVGKWSNMSRLKQKLGRRRRHGHHENALSRLEVCATKATTTNNNSPTAATAIAPTAVLCFELNRR